MAKAKSTKSKAAKIPEPLKIYVPIAWIREDWQDDYILYSTCYTSDVCEIREVVDGFVADYGRKPDLIYAVTVPPKPEPDTSDVPVISLTDFGSTF